MNNICRALIREQVYVGESVREKSHPMVERCSPKGQNPPTHLIMILRYATRRSPGNPLATVKGRWCRTLGLHMAQTDCVPFSLALAQARCERSDYH